jgi:hypothetical protein
MADPTNTVRILTDLLKQTKAVKSHLYNLSKLNKWALAVENAIEAIYSTDSKQFKEIKNLLNKLPSPSVPNTGFNVSMIQNAVDELSLNPIRSSVVNNVEMLLDSYINIIDLSQQLLANTSSNNFLKDFFNYLLKNGLYYDENDLSLFHSKNKDNKCFPNERDDLIIMGSANVFFKELEHEINLTWKLGFYASALVLTRKFVENLLIEILRKKYPPDDKLNLHLYYVSKQQRFQDFSVLVDSLEKKRSDFGPDQPLVGKAIQLIRPFKWGANATAHSIVEFPNEQIIRKYKIQQIVSLLEKILNNIS